jgi:ribosomal silencing factor RsfS
MGKDKLIVELDLRGSKVTDKGVIALAESCKSLSSINLYYCQKVTDAGIEALSKTCTSLTTIDLAGTEVTDKGVIALAKSCKSLSSIDLSYCFQVSEKLKDSLRTRGIEVED